MGMPRSCASADARSAARSGTRRSVRDRRFGLGSRSLVARSLGFAATPEALETAVSPRGYRLLARVPRLPAGIIDRLVTHFGGLQKLLAATIEDLLAVEGVGEARARGIREGLSRLAETSILDRYS